MTITNCSGSAHTFTELQGNTKYEISIRVENSVGTGPESPPISVHLGQPRPLAPENLTVVRVDSNSVELKWNATQVLFPETVDGYRVGILSLQILNCRNSLMFITSKQFSSLFARRNRPNTLCCF